MNKGLIRNTGRQGAGIKRAKNIAPERTTEEGLQQVSCRGPMLEGWSSMYRDEDYCHLPKE